MRWHGYRIMVGKVNILKNGINIKTQLPDRAGQALHQW